MATVRVRIAVAVDSSGKWNAVGYSKDDDINNVMTDEDMESAVEFVGENYVQFWLGATLPVPEPMMIEAEVLTTK